MITAGQVAIELRKLADALDVQPDAVVVKPWITFYASEKEPFLNVARLLPRPLKKDVTSADSRWARVQLEHRSSGMDVKVSVPQSLTCELIEPAKPAVYRCDPILSDAEEAEVVA
jgi:hypothetical protein